jgi:hypothetical protein
MKKLVLGLFAVALLAAVPANAQRYNRNDSYRGGGGGWVAPLVGGLIIGGVVGSVMSQPQVVDPVPVYVEPQYSCWNELIGYDAWRRPVYQRRCR